MSVRRTLAAVTVVAGLFGWVVAGAGPAAIAAGSFGPPVVVTGLNDGEPEIDIATDGTIYVNAPSGFLSNLPGSPSHVFRSDDGGSSWTLTDPGPLRGNMPGGGDSDIAIDRADGSLYMTDLWLGSSTVSVSHDRAASWVSVPTHGVVVQDRQWIATTGGGIVYHVTHQIPAGLIVSKSVGGGVVYPLQSIAATPLDQTGCICPPGMLIAEAGGGLAGLSDKVGVIYSTSTGGVKFARSTNGGLLFSSTEVSPASDADTAAGFPIVAGAGGNHLVAVWMEVQGNSSRVVFNDSHDWGATWSSPRALVSSGANLYPWVDARGSKVSVTLYHTDTPGTPDTVPAGAQWFETYLESLDGGASFSAPAAVDTTPVKSGPVCTNGSDCAGTRELLDFQSVAIDGAGRANATWTRSIDNVADTELRFARQA